MKKHIATDLKSYPEIERLLFNPTNDNYLTLDELEDKTEEHLFDRIRNLETYPRGGAGELILNYDLQFRKQKNELDELNKYLNGGILVDDKDRKLLTNDIEKSFDTNMKAVVGVISDEMSNISKRLDIIEKDSGQNCENGNCTNQSLSDLRTEIDNINENIRTNIESNEFENKFVEMQERNDNKFSEMKTSLDNLCTGIDCISKRNEKEDTVTCPLDQGGCGKTFIWDDSITNCPFCGIPLGITE